VAAGFFGAIRLHGARVGWTGDRSLAIRQDGFGLAFRLDVPSTHRGLSLVAGIRAGHFRGRSFSDGGDRAVASDIVTEGIREVRVIRRLNVAEVSLRPSGANPEACRWADVEDPEHLPPHIRHAQARWHEGRAQAQFAARAARGAPARAHARAAHPGPASAHAILAAGRPKGWLEGLEAAKRGRLG
jgi:Caudovirus prohead serine protease